MQAYTWQLGCTALECNRHLLENQTYCDVEFKVGHDATPIKAHKLILATRSAVFDRVLFGGFIPDLSVPDVEPPAFNALLRYCYYECEDVEPDEALDTLYADRKYMLPHLEEACKNILNDNLNEDLVWDVYTYSMRCGDDWLRDACRTYFKESLTAVEAMKSGRLSSVPQDVLLDMLKQIRGVGDVVEQVNKGNQEQSNTKAGTNAENNKERNGNYKESPIESDGEPHIYDADESNGNDLTNNLPIETVSSSFIPPIELFQACDSWGKVQCIVNDTLPSGSNKRQVLEDCLSLIPVQDILQSDLTDIVLPTGLLGQNLGGILDIQQYSMFRTPTTYGRFLVAEMHDDDEEKPDIDDDNYDDYMRDWAAYKDGVKLESTRMFRLLRVWIRRPWRPMQAIPENATSEFALQNVTHRKSGSISVAFQQQNQLSEDGKSMLAFLPLDKQIIVFEASCVHYICIHPCPEAIFAFKMLAPSDLGYWPDPAELPTWNDQAWLVEDYAVDTDIVQMRPGYNNHISALTMYFV